MDGTTSLRRTGQKTLGKGFFLTAAILALLAGCDSSPVPYGRENTISLSLDRPQVWALAPAIDLSGQPGVDPLIQADYCFKQLQEIKGLTIIPVNRTVSVYASLGIDRVQTVEQAAIVCDLLGADGLLVPTVTFWEPYTPPKMGGSLQLFPKPGSFVRRSDVDPRELVRQAAPVAGGNTPNLPRGGIFQSVGMYDAADGSVRESLARYMYGRHDPIGPYGEREIVYNSEKYATFVYRRLTESLLDQLFQRVGIAGDSPTSQAVDQKKAGIIEGGAAGPQAFPSNRR